MDRNDTVNGFKKVGTAVVGHGSITSAYLNNLVFLFSITDVKVISNPDAAEAARQLEKYHIAKNVSFEEVLADPEIELVVNLTGADRHFETTKQALCAGKHVFLEKPFVTSLSEAEELVRLAKEKHLYLGTAPDTILGAGLQTAKGLIEQGMIGEVTSAVAMINRNQSLNSEAFKFLRRQGGALPFDVGIYYVCALLMLIGNVTEISAFGAPARLHQPELFFREGNEGSWQISGQNLISASLKFDSGAVASVHIDGNTVNEEQSTLMIFGTKGILKLGDPNRFDGYVKLILPESEVTDMPFTHGFAGHTPEEGKMIKNVTGNRGVGSAEMAWAIRSGRKARCSADFGLHYTEVLCGMEISAETSEIYRPSSRFDMRILPSGYLGTVMHGLRGDAEKSLAD